MRPPVQCVKCLKPYIPRPFDVSNVCDNCAKKPPTLRGS